MDDRTHWELYRRRIAEAEQRAASERHLGRARRRSTRLPHKPRDGE
jgi:hypothetical protein